MATKSISQLDTQATANETDLFEVAIVDANSASGYASKKESAAAIADAIIGEYQYPLRITGTTAKTIAGAINELKNLVDLLPQFAIEVVQILPVSDISETTIYLVPAQDPEQGNYYEEYIYVNNAWELVGTTAVDLSGYYTSAQVDTLLAAKANTSSLATVATSGAYSDLSGKPTIDTALDTTSTNAVENRAVASEINSIKSDITVEGSASGDIATFGDGGANPLKELKISIVAVQSGSGDPSPTNIRPITGWTGANIFVRNQNLFDGEMELGALTATGENTPSDSSIRCKNYIAVKNVKEIYRYWDITQVASSYILWYTYKADKTFSRYLGAQTVPNNAILNSDERYLRFYIYNRTEALPSFMINYGNSALPYVAYSNNSENININWQSTAGTVYGGMLDVKNGVLTVEGAMVDLGTLNWANNAPDIFSSIVNDMSMANAQKVICTIYKYGTTQFNWNYADTYADKTINTASNNYIYIKDTAYSDAATFKAAMSDVQLVYELATPIEYNLTAQQINSLLGTNNIFADCGSVTELKYTRDLNLCINDIIARITALENASSNRSLSVSPTLTKSIVSDSDTAEGKTEETEEETKEEAQNER